MNTAKRNGNRWTINELLSLQREYELLEWTFQQIAVKHQRTERAILFRLESEGIINSWDDARGFNIENDVTNVFVCNQELCEDEDEFQECCDNDSEYHDDDDHDHDDDDNDDDNDESVCDDASEVEKLSERVWGLETAVTDIKDMVQHLFNNLVSTNQKKTKSLRKQMAVHD